MTSDGISLFSRRLVPLLLALIWLLPRILRQLRSRGGLLAIGAGRPGLSRVTFTSEAPAVSPQTSVVSDRSDQPFGLPVVITSAAPPAEEAMEAENSVSEAELKAREMAEQQLSEALLTNASAAEFRVLLEEHRITNVSEVALAEEELRKLEAAAEALQSAMKTVSSSEVLRAEMQEHYGMNLRELAEAQVELTSRESAELHLSQASADGSSSSALRLALEGHRDARVPAVAAAEEELRRREAAERKASQEGHGDVSIPRSRMSSSPPVAAVEEYLRSIEAEADERRATTIEGPLKVASVEFEFTIKDSAGFEHFEELIDEHFHNALNARGLSTDDLDDSEDPEPLLFDRDGKEFKEEDFEDADDIAFPVTVKVYVPLKQAVAADFLDDQGSAAKVQYANFQPMSYASELGAEIRSDDEGSPSTAPAAGR